MSTRVAVVDVAVLGLGRLGDALARRLAETHPVRTWSRSRPGPGLARTVVGADVVVVCVYDAAACREVLEACRGLLPDGCTVITTATVGPDEAAGLADLVADLGAQHVHAPVVGSVPAALAGGLTILTGGRPVGPAAEVLATLGRCVTLADAAEAAAAKLLANGVLGDALVTLRRSLLCAELLTLPRGTALDVLESTVLAPVVRAKRADLESGPAAAPVRFAAGALAKDLALLGRAAGWTPPAADVLDALLAAGVVRGDADVASVATADARAAAGVEPDLTHARLELAPGVVLAPAVARPLVAYALGHATGDPAYFREAFLPTAHVEGYRDGAFTSWDLDDYTALFDGRPAEDEPDRRRRIEAIDVRGRVGTARMSLAHGASAFTDSFVLLASADGEWRIANKVYERVPQAWPGRSSSPV